jgi:hypothetical protein
MAAEAERGEAQRRALEAQRALEAAERQRREEVPFVSCVVLSGPVWSCVVLCGPVWSCVVLCGPVC